jgi:NADH-quinone oxidoreductase subunit G
MSTTLEAPSVPMVTLNIDGRDVQVPKGTNVIEAARKLGIDIPYLCYHHQLTSFGGCRLCLVEVEKVPKMLAACNTIATDGMVVRTSTDRVKAQRAGTLEFILLNHPLDCPVCDKGGECELQDRTFEHSNALSRMTERKIHIEDYDLGPLIVRNQDRCIICKRCIKVMEEVVGEPVLEFGQRGVSTEVYTFEHEHFAPGFSGNTIRVCPVGALMSKPFRFKARPWELIKTPSVCSLCSVGCNLREDVRENKLLRVVGLENPQVNDGWLCDRGQFGYDYINSPDRLAAPLVLRGDGRLEETSWEEALGVIKARLQDVKGAAFGAIGSERATNEDLLALARFTREVMGSPNLDYRMSGGRKDYAPSRPAPGAVQSLGEADVVLVLGADVTAETPVLDLVLKRGLLFGKSKVVVANPRATALDKFAAQTLRYTPGREIALVNGLLRAAAEEGLVASPPPAGWSEVEQGLGTLAHLAELAGVAEADLRAAARTFAGAAVGSIIYGSAPAEARDGAHFVSAVHNLALATGQAAKPGHVCLETVTGANTWGARDQGLLPGPDGLTTGEMLQAAADGRIQALWVMQANPVIEYARRPAAKTAMETVPFLVVTDMFLTETARHADVVLPVVSLAERSGTLTNVEGRVQRAVRAMDPRGASKEDWKVLGMVAEDLGKPLGLTGDAAASRAAREAAAADRAAPGLTRVETPPAPAPETDFPMRLFTGTVLFDRGTIQGRSTVLPGLAGEPFAELNTADAARLGVAEGDLVGVNTPHGRLDLPARVTDGIPAGAVFVPSGFNEAPISMVWADGLRTAPCRITHGEGG